MKQPYEPHPLEKAHGDALDSFHEAMKAKAVDGNDCNNALVILKKAAYAYAQSIRADRDRLQRELDEEKRNRCEHCGAKIRTIPCVRCGAPQCCPQCCIIDTLQRELAEARGLLEEVCPIGVQCIYKDLDTRIRSFLERGK